MNGYTITFPTFINEDNLQFSANIGNFIFEIIARWYDNLWHIVIFLNDANKRSLIAYSNVVYFKYDKTYSIMFTTDKDTIGHDDLSGITLEVALND